MTSNPNMELNITGIEDSFYSIYDYTNTYINNNFIVGSNYFLNIDNNKTINF